MISVGIDVSNEKCMVCILRTYGEVGQESLPFNIGVKNTGGRASDKTSGDANVF